MCKKPLTGRGGVRFGCGQCVPCRINRRRPWTARIALEAMCHKESWFVTLTYDDKHLPEGGNLVPKHLQNFLKRLRFAVPEKIRFFAVGEYGDKSWRPHYHLVIFGLRDPLSCVAAWRDRDGRPIGIVHIGTVTSASAGYVAGYTVKKMTSTADDRLKGLHPEFARMSRRPAIGEPAAVQLAEYFNSSSAALSVARNGPPVTVRLGGKEWPLGRFLKSVLHAEMGIAPARKSMLWPDSMIKKEEFYVRLTERIADDGGLDRFEAKKQQRAANAAFRLRLKSQEGKLI